MSFETTFCRSIGGVSLDVILAPKAVPATRRRKTFRMTAQLGPNKRKRTLRLNGILARGPNAPAFVRKTFSLSAVLDGGLPQPISWCGGVPIDAVVARPALPEPVSMCGPVPMDAALQVAMCGGVKLDAEVSKSATDSSFNDPSFG